MFSIITIDAQQVLTMEKAMDIAQQGSPDIRKSLMRLEQSRQNLQARRASLKSKFSLNLNPIDYGRTRSFNNYFSQWFTEESLAIGGLFQVEQPILPTNGTLYLRNQFTWQDSKSFVQGVESNNRAFSNNLYLYLVQPIFSPNTLKMEIQELEHSLENAEINYALQRLSTESQITSMFYRVYTAQSNLEINRETYSNSMQSYEIIKNKVEADLAAKEELYQAELNLATARSELNESLVSLDNLKDELKQALGMDLDEEISVTTSVNIDSVVIDRDKAINHGLSSRMELRQRELTAKDLEFNLIRTKAENKFKGDITLSLGLTGDNAKFQKIYDEPISNPRVAISFTVPIFDWGANKASVRAQEIALRLNSMETDDNRISIEMEIRQSCRRLENLKTAIQIAEQNVRNAQLTYDLNLTRYREGELTGMEFNQFQTQLSSKKIAYTQSIIDYKIELLNLKILSLYDFENGKEIVPIGEY
jgi:outer membrane protein TolC